MPFKPHRARFSSQFLCVFLFFTAFSGTSIAATSNPSQLSFDSWVERVKAHAQNQGISNHTLDSVFSNVQQVQATKSTTEQVSAEQFLNHSLARQQVNLNKHLVNYYSDVLFEIKHLFGVNPEVIIALWGLDNLQDKSEKSLPAIDVLASLAYTQPRNKQLRNELFQALKIIDEGQASEHQLKSDFNGRLGATPFKPTAFRNYAIDYDGDGKFDIWQNHADIFASTANYLSSIGWKSSEPWGIEVKLPSDFNPSFTGLNQQRNISQWQQLGVRMADGSDLPDEMISTSEKMGSIISPNTSVTKAYLVFDNYFALLRWKRSQQFAFAVGMMVDKIKQPNETAPLSPLSPFADSSR